MGFHIPSCRKDCVMPGDVFFYVWGWALPRPGRVNLVDLSRQVCWPLAEGYICTDVVIFSAVTDDAVPQVFKPASQRSASRDFAD